MALDSLPGHHSKSPNKSAGYLMGLSENTWYTPNLSTSHGFSSSKYMIHIDTHPKIINCSWYSHQNLPKSDDFSSKSIKQWWYSHGILMVYHHISHPKNHLGGTSTTPWSPSCSRTNAPPDGRPQTIVAWILLHQILGFLRGSLWIFINDGFNGILKSIYNQF